MIHTLKNNTLIVRIDSVGAELQSIQNQNGREFLWQGDPDIWASRAPVLFPIIGALKEDTMFYEGKAYEMPKHGIVRYNPTLSVVKSSEKMLQLQLQSTPQTREKYPFDFAFQITYQLDDNALQVTHDIYNQGEEVMFFSVGGHPAFQCPVGEGRLYSEYFLQMENEETVSSYTLNDDGLISDQTVPGIEDGQIRLHPSLFEKDALIFKDHTSRRVTLCHDTDGELITVDFPDFSYLGVWAKPNAPFVCIEPWLGLADTIHTNQQFSKKEGIQSLVAGGHHQSTFLIRVHKT